MTVTPSLSQCTTSGTVAIPHFHFYAGWKDGAPAFFSVDWILIEELTNEHEPQIWYFENPQGSSGFPYGCTMPPVNDPENWNWTTWSLAGSMIGFAMHNSPYRITVQWRYGVYMKGPRGPFQTSIIINVQNLVVTSPDETKVLKWDPVRGIAETSFSYSLECAQKKECDVCITIYSTDGRKVYEEWLEQIAPGSYDFTWDGTMNTGYYGYYEGPPYGEEPSNIAPAGLYVFDIEVIGVAPGYDEDCLRSRTLWIGEHEVYLLAHPLEAQVSFKTPFNDTIRAFYLLHDNVSASSVLIETYDPNFALIASVSGTTKTIPESTTPSAEDWNVVDFSASLTEPTAYLPYFFVFWAWDGHSSYYKSHRPKTAFINTRRLKRSVPSQKPVLLSSPSCQFLSPPSTLFLSNLGSRKVGGINWRGKYPQAALFGIHDAIMKGLLTCPSKELMEVQWMIVNVWWQWEIRKVRYANFWEYKDDDGRWRKANMIQLYGFADGLYRGVGKSLIFKALEYTDVVTIVAHGAPTRLGLLADETTSEDITINDITQKYVPNKLRGLRLLVLMACSTGGVPKTEKQSLKIVSEPQEGTLAHAFRQAKVQCVVYTLDTIYWISVASFMNDFWPIATKIKYHPESSKKLSPSPPGITMTISVQQAVVRTIQKIADALVNQTDWSALIIARDITLIRVAGDTKLAP